MRSREFRVGDLVLHRAIGGARDINARKLALNWEGMYRVTAIAGVGAHYLEDMEERPLPRPWYVQNLKKNTIIKYVKSRILICLITNIYVALFACVVYKFCCLRWHLIDFLRIEASLG